VDQIKTEGEAVKKILLMIVLGALVGCAGGQKQALKDAYARGELTAAQYYQLEFQRQADRQQAWQNVGQSLQNFGTYLQNDRAINKMNQPQVIYVVPLGR
jgi:hypothetical protein